MNWHSFQEGMTAARSSGEPGAQATSDEARALGGPDFTSDADRDWHRGYDHAVLLARKEQGK